MEKTGYERYGLTGNPFRDLSSESIENVEIFHVPQAIDSDIQSMTDEVLAKENKAVIALLGSLGSGKTERLLILKNQANQEKALWAMCNITSETKWVVIAVAEEIMKSAKLGSFSRVLAAPAWYKDLNRVVKSAVKGYDPEKAGMAIVNALNQNAPSFLLLNDLHNLEKGEDSARFLKVLHVMFDHIDKGVMVMMASSESYFDYITSGQESLLSRVNKRLVIQPLSNQEANLMIAKRLLAKRVVEDMPALYPFSESAIPEMNQAAKGNPRELLKIADKVIDDAAKKKLIQINGDIVKGVLSMSDIEEIESPLETKDGDCAPGISKV